MSDRVSEMPKNLAEMSLLFVESSQRRNECPQMDVELYHVRLE